MVLVEDDEILWPFLAALLDSQGFEVERVCDGEKGLQRLAEASAGLLIIDANISSPSASEFLRRVRRTALASEPPILCLIMPGQSSLRGTMGDLGVDEFITEPFDPAEILAAASRLTRRGRAS